MKSKWLLFIVVICMTIPIHNYCFGEQLEIRAPWHADESWRIIKGSLDHYGVDALAEDFNYEDGGHTDYGRVIIFPINVNDARVVRIEWNNPGYGNYLDIVFQWEDRWYILRMAHLATITVEEDQIVTLGEQIGLCGNSGTSSTHLHIALYLVNEGKSPNTKCYTSSESGKPINCTAQPFTSLIHTCPDTNHTTLCTSNNRLVKLIPVGYEGNDLENDFSHSNTSMNAAIARAHGRNSNPGLGSKIYSCPGGNPNNNNGPYVHDWLDWIDGILQPTGVKVQDFPLNCYGNDPAPEKRGVVIAYMDTQGRWQAHALRDKFNELYGSTGGPLVYGPAITDEGVWIDEYGIMYMAAQQFKNALFLWDSTHTAGEVEVRMGADLPSGIITIAKASTIHIAGNYTGGSEETFTITADDVAHDRIDLGVHNDGQLDCGSYKVIRNSSELGSFSSVATNITDPTVIANTTYSYMLQCYTSDWGVISVTKAITVTTPPNPGTFELSVIARTSHIVDLEIRDTSFNAQFYSIQRNNIEIARIAGREFTDIDVTALATYSYSAQALTQSGTVLGTTPSISLTTPDVFEPEPDLEPEPPAHDPNYPLRVVSGITLVNPLPPTPIISGDCVTVRFGLKNLDANPIFIDRIQPKAEVDQGFQTVTKYFWGAVFTPPLELAPGGIYYYEGNNCSNPFPLNSAADVTVKPYVKYRDFAGLYEVTDMATDADGLLTFHVFESNQNADLVVTSLNLLPQNPFEGDDIQFVLGITNIGDRLTTSQVEITLSSTSGFDDTDWINSIEPGQTVYHTVNLGIHTAGIEQFGYQLDLHNLIFEWNENNNAGEVTYRVAEDSIDPDADNDSVPDNIDNCPSTPNTSQIDSDNDGFGDDCDICPLDSDNDVDNDTVCGDIDNCPASTNADQANSDGDLVGDICDICPLDFGNDSDNDGVCESNDNCPLLTNSGQEDNDSDGMGNACDNCPEDALNDDDNDSICGNIDNCPDTSNVDQLDSDGNGIGDACEPISEPDQYLGILMPSSQYIRWGRTNITGDENVSLYYEYALSADSDGIAPDDQGLDIVIATAEDGEIFSLSIEAQDIIWSARSSNYSYSMNNMLIKIYPYTQRIDLRGSNLSIDAIQNEPSNQKLVTVSIYIGNDILVYTDSMQTVTRSRSGDGIVYSMSD